MYSFLVAIVDRGPARPHHGGPDPRRPAAAPPSWRSPRPAWCSPRSPSSCSASASSTCSRSRLHWVPVAGRGTGSRRTCCRWCPSRSARPRYSPASCRVEMLGRAARRLRAHRARQAAAGLAALPAARAAERADRHAHDRRPAAVRHGRGHGPGRERLRLAGPRQHDRVVDPRQGLPGRAGRRARLRHSACCWSTSSSTSRSRCSTRARRSGRADSRGDPMSNGGALRLRTPLGVDRVRAARDRAAVRDLRADAVGGSQRPRSTPRTSCRAVVGQHWLGTDNLGRTSSTASWSPPGCRSSWRCCRPRSAWCAACCSAPRR